jgi:hypothetical protein
MTMQSFLRHFGAGMLLGLPDLEKRENRFMFIKNAVFFSVIATLVAMQSSFASSQASIQQSDSFHDGETYRSFQLCQNGSCRQLGPAQEYPVNWLGEQADQHLLNAAMSAPAAGAVALFLSPTVVGIAAAGAVGGIMGKQAGLAVVAYGAEKYSNTFETDKQTETYAKSLEKVLSNYGKPPLHIQIANDVKAVYSGALSSVKALYAANPGASDMVLNAVAANAVSPF